MAKAQQDQHNRVRESTPETINRELDQEILDTIARFRKLPAEAMTRRIKELDQEWDIERALEVNASSLALTGILLGFTTHKRWFILPGIVTAFLLQHGLQGWCPPLPLLRKLGFRTRKEIDQERYALKLLRHDFAIDTEKSRPENLLQAVRK